MWSGSPTGSVVCVPAGCGRQPDGHRCSDGVFGPEQTPEGDERQMCSRGHTLPAGQFFLLLSKTPKNFLH